MISELTDAVCSLSPWPRIRASSTTSSPAKWFIDWVSGGDSTDSGIRLTPATALSYAPVFQAVSVLAGDVGQLPLDLYKREGEQNKEKAKTHRAYRLMRRRANDYMSAGTFRETLMYYALFWGNGCAEIERDNAGSPRNLWPLLPDRTSLVVENGHPWYITRVGERPFKIRPRDVLHIRNFGHDGLWGYSTLTLARNSWALGLAGGKYAGKFFANNGLPTGVLEVEGELEDEDWKRLKRDWREAHEGLDNAARVAILEEGTKFTPLAFNFKDAQWLEGRQFSREEVAAWFNLPPHFVGAMEHATFSNIEHQSLDYLNRSLMRWLVKWQEECDEKLLTERAKTADSHFFEFNTAALLRGDLKTRYEAHAIALTHAFKNPNEVRAIENDNSYEGGDEFRSQMNMEPASGEPEPDDDEPDDDVAADGVVKTTMARLQTMGDDQVERVAVQMVREMDALQEDANQRRRNVVTSFQSELNAIGTKAGDAVEADIAEKLDVFQKDLAAELATSITQHTSTLRDRRSSSVTTFTREANDIAKAVLREFMAEAKARATIASMLRMEINRVTHAARTSRNFCDFLNRFYDDWPTKVAERLNRYDVEIEHPEAIAAWAEESKAACLDVAGKVTDTAGLEEAVSLAVATWPQRADGLCAGILKESIEKAEEEGDVLSDAKL